MGIFKCVEINFINERKSEQVHISHAPTLLENAVYNEWQFQALVTGNGIMSFITTKFQEILLGGFSGVTLTNCFSSIFHFGQISKFKKGVTQRKKNCKKKFPVDKLIYTLCPSLLQSFRKFCWGVSEELRWQEKQDWLTDRQTDGRVKNNLPSATRCVGYNNWKIHHRSCNLIILLLAYSKQWDVMYLYVLHVNSHECNSLKILQEMGDTIYLY